MKDKAIMKKPRTVTIERLSDGGFAVYIVGRKSRGRYWAASFYREKPDGTPRTIEDVREWVKSKPHLTEAQS